MYYRFQGLIRLTVKVFSILPKPVLRFFYAAVEPFPGVVFVFCRYVLISNLCKSVGDNVYIGNYVELRRMENLQIGSNVSINKGSYLDALGGIAIGDDVSIAHQCSIVSFEHSWSNPSLPIRKNPTLTAPIEIGADVWVGAGVRILAGARIATRCVIGAGSVVTRRTEPAPGFLIAGVPAKPIKKLT